MWLARSTVVPIPLRHDDDGFDRRERANVGYTCTSAIMVGTNTLLSACRHFGWLVMCRDGDHGSSCELEWRSVKSEYSAKYVSSSHFKICLTSFLIAADGIQISVGGFVLFVPWIVIEKRHCSQRFWIFRLLQCTSSPHRSIVTPAGLASIEQAGIRISLLYCIRSSLRRSEMTPKRLPACKLDQVPGLKMPDGTEAFIANVWHYI